MTRIIIAAFAVVALLSGCGGGHDGPPTKPDAVCQAFVDASNEKNEGDLSDDDVKEWVEWADSVEDIDLQKDLKTLVILIKDYEDGGEKDLGTGLQLLDAYNSLRADCASHGVSLPAAA